MAAVLTFQHQAVATISLLSVFFQKIQLAHRSDAEKQVPEKLPGTPTFVQHQPEKNL